MLPKGPLPPKTLKKIADLAREHSDVIAAWIFGSRAGDGGTALSDVDLAFLLDAHAAGDRFARRLALMSDCSRALGSDRVDVIVLNDAPLSLAHSVIATDRLLYCRDDRARGDFHASVLDRYFDTEPLRRELNAGLRDRIEEGRFGR